jgi:hypothetical protein
MKRKNNGHRRRLPREAMLTRDAAVWAMHLARMTPTEIGAELGVPRQTIDRSLERSAKLHANDDPLQHPRECLTNQGTAEPVDDPNLTPDRNGRVWDRWASSLTVADVERIAQTPHPALTLYRLRSHVPNLPPGVRRAIGVAWKALPGPEDDDVAPQSWRAGAVKAVAKARGTSYTGNPEF